MKGQISVIIDRSLYCHNFKERRCKNLLARSDASIQIVGLVTDENGEPISGASVSLKGSTVGTITDIDGKYTSVCRQQSRYWSFLLSAMYLRIL